MRSLVYLLLVAAVILCAVSLASAFDRDIVPFSDRFPVSISITDHSDVYVLQKLNLDIDAAEDDWVRAYVDQSEFDALEAMGYELERIPNQALRMWRSIKESEHLEAKDVYHDYDAVTTYLEGVAADHPAITHLASILMMPHS
jgi:hypothetical protein